MSIDLIKMDDQALRKKHDFFSEDIEGEKFKNSFRDP